MGVIAAPLGKRLHLRALLAAAAGAAALGPGAGIAPAQPVAPATPVTVDGPGSGGPRVAGMSIARDGTGGIVYLKQVAGAQHVFVSRLLSGVFQPPEQLDGSLGGASSDPVIAAGNGGVLLVAFINAGTLYVVDRQGASGPPQGPMALFAPASNPAIAITNFGKAYLAFTAETGAGNHDVRCAYYFKGSWALEPTPLDAVASDDAGTGAGRPAVAAAGDGVALVVWGEAGHVYSRRVWGTSPSVVYEQADVPGLNGWSEVAADSPAAGVGGDSSYVDVEFRETLSDGARQQQRVFLRRLRGSQYDPGVVQADGLSTPGAIDGDQPRVALGEYGSGVATAAQQGPDQVWATPIAGSGIAAGVERLDSLPNASAPYAVPAMAGLFSDLVAWQHDPGPAGIPEIRVRYADDGESFGPEVILSSPAQGPTEAGSGLVAAGDVDGDAAVAWVQGTGSSARVMAAQLYRAPGAFSPRRSFAYSRSRHPVLSWNPPRGRWGPIRYRVTLDGAVVGETTATSLTVPDTLSDGPHRWRVTATNPAGEQSTSSSARVWVDAVAPLARVSLRGARRAGSRLRLHVSYTDAPPGEPRADASGIAGVVIRWGDGSSSRLRKGGHTRLHAYRRAGRYRLTVTVTDRAGNRTVLVRLVRIR